MEAITPIGLYGPLGAIAVALMTAVVHLYLDGRKQTREHKEELAAQQEKHRAEFDILMNRHILKAENWAEKGVALADSLNAILDSAVVKRRDR